VKEGLQSSHLTTTTNNNTNNKIVVLHPLGYLDAKKYYNHWWSL
jgi:hypothetical protein